LNQTTNILAMITDEDDAIYEQVYSLQGHIYLKHAMYQEALEWFEKAKEQADRCLGEDSRSSAQIASYIVEVHIKTGNHA
jgi:hypothetical protein